MSSFSLIENLPSLKWFLPALPKGIPIYLVGGAVRDAILGRVTHDFDFVIDHEGMIALRVARTVADRLKAAVYPLHDTFDAARVIIDGQKGEQRIILDFVGRRGEDIDADLLMRDFTINAMAVPLQPLHTNQLIDPLQGLIDLKEKRIKICSPDAFRSDPVRILRAVRLAVELDFQIEPVTRCQLRQNIINLPHSSSERIRDEIFRMMEGTKPGTTIKILDTLGVLENIFPEVVPLRGIEQPGPHIYDVWAHTLETLNKLQTFLALLGKDYHPDPEKGYAPDLAYGLAVTQLGRFRESINNYLQEQINPGRPKKGLLFLAALYHDVGKSANRQIDEEGRTRFINHEETGAKLIEKRARLLQFSNQEIDHLKRIVRNHMRPLLLGQSGQDVTKRSVYRFFGDAGQAGVGTCLLSVADFMAIYGYTLPVDAWQAHLSVVHTLLEAWFEQRETQVYPTVLLSGKDLIQLFDLKPGPEIGELLDSLREAQASGEIVNRDQAIAYVQRILGA